MLFEQMLILVVQVMLAVFGSFAALRALDSLSGVSFGKDILSIIQLDAKAMALYASVRFAAVTGAMAYLCGRFIG